VVSDGLCRAAVRDLAVMVRPRGSRLAARGSHVLTVTIPLAAPGQRPFGVAASSWAAETVPTTCSFPERSDRTSS
jgi:hypothetical protein